MKKERILIEAYETMSENNIFIIKGKKYWYNKDLNSGKDFKELSDNDTVGLYDKDDEQVYKFKKIDLDKFISEEQLDEENMNIYKRVEMLKAESLQKLEWADASKNSISELNAEFDEALEGIKSGKYKN